MNPTDPQAELPKMLGRSPDRHKYYPNPRPHANLKQVKAKQTTYISVIDGKVKHV